jgi:hypothetical protein
MADLKSLFQLPPEIAQGILQSVDNVRWLPSLLLSHRNFYRSMTKTTPSQVLRNQIPSSLLPYALAAHHATEICSTDVESVKSFLNSLNSSLKGSSNLHDLNPDIDLSTALKIGRLHDVVHKLALYFADTTLQKLRPSATPRAHHLSQREYGRVCRAFYRAEIYFRLFPKFTQDKTLLLTREDRTRFFFGPYSPWVNEQLVCVHDFLERKISDSVFYEVATHDIDFGEFCADYLTVGHENSWIQGYVCSIPHL